MVRPRKIPPGAGWRLRDAKARFSEVVRRAQTEGPRRLTVRGRNAVVVIAADELDRLVPRAGDAVRFLAFLESLDMDELDLTRERDSGRNALTIDEAPIHSG